MAKRWLTSVVLAGYAVTAAGIPVRAQTVTVDASEAIRQVHMSDMIGSGEQLQQQRLQSMMQQPMGGGYGGGSNIPHMDRSQADALARKTADLDRFAPDAAATKALVQSSVSAYEREGSNHQGVNKLLANAIAKTHDGHSIEQIFTDLVAAWHSNAQKHNFGNRVSEAYLYLIEVAYSVRSTTPHRPEQSTLDQLSFGLQNTIVSLQLSAGHAYSNAEKRKLFDSLGVVGFLVAASASGKFGDDLATEAKAEADRQIAHFGSPADLNDFAHTVEHRATTAILRRYPDVLALR